MMNYMLARQHQGWYWLHLTNIMMALGELPGRGPYPSTLFWSLAVEEQFYFAWFTIGVMLDESTASKGVHRRSAPLHCAANRLRDALISAATLSVLLPITRGDTFSVGGFPAIESIDEAGWSVT